MRMITSAQIRSDPEEYDPFLSHPDTGEKMQVREFCETFVEVLGKEAGEPFFRCRRFYFLHREKGRVLKIKFGFFFTDHVQVTAISRALRINVKIAYLDGRSSDGRVEFVTFNNAINEAETPLTLIYR